ncbi:MAG: nuclear transport factor 2 family protein [Chloroflexota bacterium]|nr:nuclear transport factor 2 family protein [Chloroflexota bacterium]
MRKFMFVAALALLIAAVGCGNNSPPPPPGGGPAPRQRTPTPVPANDEEAIRQIVVAEGEAVVQQDIDRLNAMWDKDGVVTDANHTPDNPSDDKTWKGWAAIRDRYVNIVFPSNPAFAEHPNIRVTITGDTAIAIADTKSGITKLKDNDKWTFRKIDGQWRITSLTFSLAPQS